MRRVLAVAAVGLVVLGCQVDRSTEPGAPVFAKEPAGAGLAWGPVPDQYIVVLANQAGNPDVVSGQLAAAYGASTRFVYRTALRGFSARMSAAAAEALARNPNVALVEQDQEVFAIGTQTMDPNGDPWGLDRIDARSGRDGAYNYSGTGSGVNAYIIDTGILTTHNDFGGRAAGGFSAINDGNGTGDCNGHGTHVAGTVGGNTYGVAKSVALVPVRVLNCSGSGTWDQVIAGIDWVTANRVLPAVANMSLGGGASSAVDQAVRNSIAAGVAYAVAAGNGNWAGVAQNACNYSPARVAEAMTIGATDKTDTKASWSNYGNCVDFFAPGVGIKSAWSTGNTATNTISGTSMATPHTAGVAALYLQSNPGATPQQVRDALYDVTTRGVVQNSSTANNHLLYSPPSGFGAPPPPSSQPVLTATTSKVKRNWTTQLSWSGFASTVTSVRLLRNGSVLATNLSPTGGYTDSGKGGGTYTYQVCANNESTCSNQVTVSP